jgi:hypothetical protein
MDGSTGLVHAKHTQTCTLVDREDSAGRLSPRETDPLWQNKICSEAPMYRYAWLEFDGGMWHFVKDLCADPGESTRRWSERECALTDLMEEGWTVVRPYSAKLPMGENKDGIAGYGLVRHCQHAESPLSMADTGFGGQATQPRNWDAAQAHAGDLRSYPDAKGSLILEICCASRTH